ncbi:spore germination protein [Cohnella zeiphila]|uniref:Spore germination protein n=1 Tax=Cohnella zeiphila TaxID=2761120 RepID=A0A7X0SSA9_9BACL|nr:spore germination protein [Cohnella zeiphila]MBB6735196.1 spore germination protein [Cohnella zeiphila]
MDRTEAGSRRSVSPGEAEPWSENLDDNLARIRRLFEGSSDFVILPWRYGPDLAFRSCSFFYDSLVQERHQNYMKSVLQDLLTHEVGPGTELKIDELAAFFERRGVSAELAQMRCDLPSVAADISAGHVVVAFDGWNRALSFSALSVESRQVAEPTNESVVQGPHESTVENLQKNLGLLRLRLQSPNFKIVRSNGGGESQTQFAYGFIEGKVDPGLLEEFRVRLEKTRNMEILESSYIEQLIEDSPLSPFPQHRYTERPDTAVAAMLDGKIAVLVQGTGSILLCPGKFTEFFQSGEDYYQRTIFSSIIRILRINAFIIALTLPSLYIALTTYHPELIPTILLLAVIDAREGIPLPAFFEALLMEFFFELLREAGVRLPKSIGSAVSIVGALVIGDAAISAGIASPIMVVIVALTGIASFTIPQYNFAIALRILRFPLMVSAALLGGFGMMICFLLILLHLCSLRTLGQPYLAPLAPLRLRQFRDVVIRAPLSRLLRNPVNRGHHRSVK